MNPPHKKFVIRKVILLVLCASVFIYGLGSFLLGPNPITGERAQGAIVNFQYFPTGLPGPGCSHPTSWTVTFTAKDGTQYSFDEGAGGAICPYPGDPVLLWYEPRNPNIGISSHGVIFQVSFLLILLVGSIVLGRNIYSPFDPKNRRKYWTGV